MRHVRDHEYAALCALRTHPGRGSDVMRACPQIGRSVYHALRSLESGGLVSVSRSRRTGCGDDEPLIYRITDLGRAHVLGYEMYEAALADAARRGVGA